MVGLTWPKWNQVRQELVDWYRVLQGSQPRGTTVLD